MPVRVLITGAAGQIGYQLASMVARGDMLGPKEEVILHLFDLSNMEKPLEGVKMELDDCAFPLLRESIVTVDETTAFKDIDIALMVGAMPRKEGMERKDLLSANVKIFKSQGKALNTYAKKTVKVIVVGNPANTNALIMSKFAPDIPKENFSSMTRLDQNRARSMLARRLEVPCDHVRNCVIWGNHSNTQFVDASHAELLKGGKWVTATPEVGDDNWFKTDYIKTIQLRGAAVIAARKASSAMSAAKAIVDHIHDWWHGTKAGEWAVMSVISDGSYGVEKGLVFGFPVTIKDKKWTIVQGLNFDAWSKSMFDKTLQELSEERKAAESICA